MATPVGAATPGSVYVVPPSFTEKPREHRERRRPPPSGSGVVDGGRGAGAGGDAEAGGDALEGEGRGRGDRPRPGASRPGGACEVRSGRGGPCAGVGLGRSGGSGRTAGGGTGGGGPPAEMPGARGRAGAPTAGGPGVARTVRPPAHQHVPDGRMPPLRRSRAPGGVGGRREGSGPVVGRVARGTRCPWPGRTRPSTPAPRAWLPPAHTFPLPTASIPRGRKQETPL